MSTLGVILLWLAMQGSTTTGTRAIDQSICVMRYADGTVKTKLCDSTAPEPIDVPAIQEMRKTRCDTGYILTCIGSESCRRCTTELKDEPITTCADKSRILLTAQDGKHWCHKVQN